MRARKDELEGADRKSRFDRCPASLCGEIPFDDGRALVGVLDGPAGRVGYGPLILMLDLRGPGDSVRPSVDVGKADRVEG